MSSTTNITIYRNNACSLFMNSDLSMVSVNRSPSRVGMEINGSWKLLSVMTNRVIIDTAIDWGLSLLSFRSHSRVLQNIRVSLTKIFVDGLMIFAFVASANLWHVTGILVSGWIRTSRLFFNRFYLDVCLNFPLVFVNCLLNNVSLNSSEWVLITNVETSLLLSSWGIH
jgi:hypothetical protein